MDRLLTTLRQTRASKVVAVLRLLLGLLFVSTGLMKLLVPELREAFSGQLTQAAIPAHTLNMWFVPLAEVAVGLLLLVGLFALILLAWILWAGGGSWSLDLRHQER
ncbi:MAG: DoxX family membrane protein [Deltaproteobacteria bacterium]|nr:DoxX family membrane protein [Deltaproteobacteria bacterium]